MAEQVNQRIEDMINELEQMRRTTLYTDEEIKEISRKRKEFEYHIQRRVKQKEDYVQYITYELALLEDIAVRRKKLNLHEKKKDMEYAIAKRINRVFKQFIHRFQNDLNIYFEYIKFCKSVNFKIAISGIIGEMLQIHGDKPKVWLLASKWETEEQSNLDGARTFLLKGLQRHPEAEELYLELFKQEISILSFNAETDEEKEKQIKKADVIWKNGMKNTNNVNFLFRLFDLCLKFEVEGELRDAIEEELWSRRKDEKLVWSYVAQKILEGYHFSKLKQYDNKHNTSFSKTINTFINVYEDALEQFPDEKLCAEYIRDCLSLNDNICNEMQKVEVVKHAWFFGHNKGLLTDKMYHFGIEMFKVLAEMTSEQILEILTDATKKKPQIRYIWEQMILLNKPDEAIMLKILQQSVKALGSNDAVQVYNLVMDNVEKTTTFMDLYKKFQMCENAVLLSVKPKLLQKMYDHNGLKAARNLYEDLIRTPPIQIEVNKIMIAIESEQDKPNVKAIRKCYECAVQYHGTNNVDIWMEYVKFETVSGNVNAASLIYQRAVRTLKKEIVDEFIKAQTLLKLKQL